MSEPYTFPRRILVAVTGLSPQVVTETLFALAVQQQPAFVPTEIHLITTKEGASGAKRSLLDQTSGGFNLLCQDYNLHGIDFSEDNIHVLTDIKGVLLDDIRTPEDNRRAADLITAILRDLTSDPDSAVHVSIAGGRKTMGFLVGYALTLFGRPQDRLSHILVSSPFESSHEFFYPPSKSKIIEIANKKLADSAMAQVTLADIPFVSLRQGLPELLLTGEATYLDTVDAARRSLGPVELVVDISKRSVMIYGSTCTLPDGQLAMLMVFIRRAINGEQPIYAPSKGLPDRDWGGAFLDELRFIVGPLGDIDSTERALRSGMEGEYFSTTLSRLRTLLKKRLHNSMAGEIIHDGGCRPKYYSLAIRPEAITIKT